MADDLLTLTDRGLECAAGAFAVDPWRGVDRAVITHAHSDHARWGCGTYLAERSTAALLKTRLGPEIDVRPVEYGEAVEVNGVRVSLHPAGHVLGSAQVRVERRGEVWVVSGDYKLDSDPTARPFEPVRCHTFITESTFGLPVFIWPKPADVFREINDWWRGNAAEGRASMLLCYALGKAQRVLAGLDPEIGAIYTHGAVEKLTEIYRDQGVAMPETKPVHGEPRGRRWAGAMIVAPPSAWGTPWATKFGPTSVGVASGWMLIRGIRRRRAADRGFVLSDHADWPGLLAAVDASAASRVLVTHGYTATFARWLGEQGREAAVLATPFRGEDDGAVPTEPEP